MSHVGSSLVCRLLMLERMLLLERGFAFEYVDVVVGDRRLVLIISFGTPRQGASLLFGITIEL